MKSSVNIEERDLSVIEFNALRPTGSDLTRLRYFDKFSHSHHLRIPNYTFQARARFHTCRWTLSLLPSQLPQKPAHRIIILVNNAFFKWNNRVVGNVNVLGAHFGAAFGDVAEADAEFVFQQLSAIQSVKRMHL